jgi:hypothetical protein
MRTNFARARNIAEMINELGFLARRGKAANLTARLFGVRGDRRRRLPSIRANVCH